MYNIPFNGSLIRVINKDGKPWFVAKDIADILGYPQANRITRNLDNENKSLDTIQTNGGEQKLSTINKAGLFQVIYKSRHPESYALQKIISEQFSFQEEEKEYQSNHLPAENVNTFYHQLFGEIRVIDRNNQSWFIAKDVAEVLGYEGARKMTRNLEGDEITIHIVETNGGPREITLINESGLFSAILKSRRPEAKIFKKWVTKEVLPSIRKHGAYINGQEIDGQKMIMAKALLAVESMLKSKDKQLEVAEEYIKEAKPKVEFYDDVTQAYDAITVGEAAKILGTGRNRLYAELRLNGWLNQNNEPYQHVIEKGYLDAKLTQFNPDKEGLTSSVAPFVTGKGLTVLQRMRTLEQAA